MKSGVGEAQTSPSALLWRDKGIAMPCETVSYQISTFTRQRRLRRHPLRRGGAAHLSLAYNCAILTSHLSTCDSGGGRRLHRAAASLAEPPFNSSVTLSFRSPVHDEHTALRAAALARCAARASATRTRTTAAASVATAAAAAAGAAGSPPPPPPPPPPPTATAATASSIAAAAASDTAAVAATAVAIAAAALAVAAATTPPPPPTPPPPSPRRCRRSCAASSKHTR